MLWLYGGFMRWLEPFLRLKLRLRARKEPLYGLAVDERFGHYQQPPQKGLVWMHAVSLGETRAILGLVQAMRQAHPGIRFVFTHGTATGREQGQSLLQEGDVQVWQPWDTRGAVQRFFQHFQPSVGFLVDTEVWPMAVNQARQSHIPLILINARMSERSLRRALQWSWLSRPAFQGLQAVWAQTTHDARRFQRLGAQVQAVMGNLKFDAVPDPGLLAKGLALRQAAKRPVILLAISREGEEAALLKVLQENPDYMQGVQWWIVPRHPQRFDAVAQMVKAAGGAMSRRSDWGDGLTPLQDTDETPWVLGDSMGEMPFYFAAAHVCLLGGSFEPLGGQNLIEACACGCPVVMGPHTFNFSQAASLALKHDAATRVSTMAEGVKVAYQLATQAQSRVRASQAASAFAKAHQGAMQRCLDLMQPWLGSGSGGQ